MEYIQGDPTSHNIENNLELGGLIIIIINHIAGNLK